jgi:hypothetical protein
VNSSCRRVSRALTSPDSKAAWYAASMDIVLRGG